MDLFNSDLPSGRNLLPYDGTVHYYGQIFSPTEANHYLHVLLDNIHWKNDEAFIMGKHIITKRKTAWYGDQPFTYGYSGTVKTALPWSEKLLTLKKIVEDQTGESYNSCLLNLYHDGNEGMAYHSDDEKELAEHAAIASLSFGAERKFLFKHKKTRLGCSVFLEHGSLLVMKDDTQKNWLHRLPVTKKATRPRVNLTFRTMVASL